MAHSALDVLDVHATRHEPGGLGVSELMEAKACEAAFLRELAPPAREVGLPTSAAVTRPSCHSSAKEEKVMRSPLTARPFSYSAFICVRTTVDTLNPTAVIYYGSDLHGVMDYPRSLGIPVWVYPGCKRGALDGGKSGQR